jgi:CHAT domain-containing protein
MEIAISASDNDLLAAAMSQAAGSSVARANALLRERLSADNSDYASALRALQDADAELDLADRALLRSVASGADLEEPRVLLVSARALRESALAALVALDGTGGQRLEPSISTVAAIRDGLAENEALLAIIPAYDGVYSLLVTGETSLGMRIAIPRAELVALAQRVRDGAANLQFEASEAERLAGHLLPPQMRAALEQISVLKILGGGALASLPFGILPFSPQDEGANGANGAGQWLLDRFALVNVTSLEVLERRRVDRTSPGGFVAFAAPSPFVGPSGLIPSDDGKQTRGSVLSPAAYFGRQGAEFSALADLPALPQSEDEARTIAREFGAGSATVFTGDAASESNVLDARVSAAEVIVFATHGLVGGEVEGIAEPALVLARPGPDEPGDGLLTASEIARLNLSADWVILTACDSAAGFSGGVPAFSGLVRAFRFAGGGSLLATHWQVRDDVAAYVAIETLRHYREFGHKPKALNYALNKLRHESGLDGADRPDIWGPFVLVE